MRARFGRATKARCSLAAGCSTRSTPSSKGAENARSRRSSPGSTGLAFKGGTLYIAELSKISKFEKIEDNLDNPPKPTLIYDDLPKDEPHGWKFLTIGPDNKLYFQVGAPCNICMPPPTHAQIRRINLDGSGAEVVARGIRQIVGMDFSPTSKQLYFTENSRDWLSEDFPADKLNRLA